MLKLVGMGDVVVMIRLTIAPKIVGPLKKMSVFVQMTLVILGRLVTVVLMIVEFVIILFVVKTDVRQVRMSITVLRIAWLRLLIYI
jgi:hypothetical protein